MAFTIDSHSDGIQVSAAPDVYETIYDRDINAIKFDPDTMLFTVDATSPTVKFKINEKHIVTVPPGMVIPVRSLNGFTKIEAFGVGAVASVGWGPGVFAG